MMDQTVSKLLNEQINKEFYSAYLYLDIANFMMTRAGRALPNWWREIRAKEEMDHAMLFYHYRTTMMNRLPSLGHRQAGQDLLYLMDL